VGVEKSAFCHSKNTAESFGYNRYRALQKSVAKKRRPNEAGKNGNQEFKSSKVRHGGSGVFLLGSRSRRDESFKAGSWDRSSGGLRKQLSLNAEAQSQRRTLRISCSLYPLRLCASAFVAARRLFTICGAFRKFLGRGRKFAD
jgi:hypothetical protein